MTRVQEAVGWSGVAEAYAATFARLCAGTFDAVLAEAGLPDPSVRRVLDVGAGTGDLAARALALGAEVTAVDPDPEMLALTARAAPAASLVRAGLPALPLPDARHDAVVANFVVNHLPDPRAGLGEMARVATPGGRVVVTIWPCGQNVQSRLWDAVIEASGAVRTPGVGLPPAMDFPRTVDGLAGLLDGAGLVDVRARALRWTHRTEPDALWRGAAVVAAGTRP
ncbi:methyltransferase domain-containing protein [Nocardioides guangzhouensis]|uniref:Methyltransferase domain-containing protein n=1 Tax=Nocardioides guangzhouensis TaxID=2497878 RepID=A0A4Q4ZK22_9ACTN|nr:methyltransferase domain-containing protein [Nocardioides guangzhouensis]RYP88702.1 methyltransferase domain-containing protein [Nocardioides guangzhouensis]